MTLLQQIELIDHSLDVLIAENQRLAFLLDCECKRSELLEADLTVANRILSALAGTKES